MEHDFWHQRWQSNKLGFHLPEANPLLLKHLPALNLKQAARVFVPLCGKTLDIAWLLAQGYQVAGVELSALAIEDCFKALNIIPSITKLEDIRHYSAPNIDLFVGDIFKLTNNQLGKVDAIYDRAALVALPDEMRENYVDHLVTLTDKAPQLLVCLDYDQNLVAGPPFAINTKLVKQYYGTSYGLTLLASEDGLKGKWPATEEVWHLHAKG